MDFSKIIAVISAFVLIVCLVLSMTTLVVLRNAVAENGQVQKEARTLVDELNVSVERLETTTDSALKNENQSDVPTGADPERFTLREYEGKIAVYAEDGVILHWVNVNLDLLPKNERAALKEGVEVEGVASLLSHLQDYMS
jgi:hypothetical protein